MSEQFSLLLAIFLVVPGNRTLFAQRQSEAPLRYRLIQVVEATTLEEKVNEAARDGYRLSGITPASGGTTVAILERTSDPQRPYSYLLLGGKGDAALQQSLNDASGKGFRLISRNVALDWRTPVPLQLRTVIAWMEKTPDVSAKFEYAVVAFGVKSAMKATLNPKLWADLNPLDYVKPEISRQQANGFRLVRIVSGVALILEKGSLTETSGPPHLNEETASALPQAFHSLTSLHGSKLQRKLQEESNGGYCVADIDPEAPAVWPSILLDKDKTTPTGGTARVCVYEVLEKRGLGEEEFNQEGHRGFRLVPQSLNFFGAIQIDPRGQPKMNAIFERLPATHQAFQYRSVISARLPELSGKLEQAGAEGFHVIKVDSVKDGVLAIMERPLRTDVGSEQDGQGNSKGTSTTP